MIRPLVAVAAALFSLAGSAAVADQASGADGQATGSVGQSADAIASARDAVAEADFGRVMRDRAYAGQILGHLDRLAADADAYAELARTIETLRLFPLVSLERTDEVRGTLDRLLAMRPDLAGHYPGAIMASLSIGDYGRFAATVETASLNVRGVGWGELRGYLDRDAVWPALQRLKREDGRPRSALPRRWCGSAGQAATVQRATRCA